MVFEGQTNSYWVIWSKYIAFLFMLQDKNTSILNNKHIYFRFEQKIIIPAFINSTVLYHLLFNLFALSFGRKNILKI